MDRQIDRYIDGWIDGCIDGQIGRWIDIWIGSQMYIQQIDVHKQIDVHAVDRCTYSRQMLQMGR